MVFIQAHHGTNVIILYDFLLNFLILIVVCRATPIDWIEKLLQKPLDDFRKYCTTFVFTPYFINTKRLSQTEAFNLTKDWLDRCAMQCKRLDFNPRTKINDAIKSVKSYPPKTPDKLRVDNPPLYTRLEKEGIIC